MRLFHDGNNVQPPAENAKERAFPFHRSSDVELYVGYKALQDAEMLAIVGIYCASENIREQHEVNGFKVVLRNCF